MSETDNDTQSQKLKTSRLALTALAFGVVTWCFVYMFMSAGFFALLGSFFAALLSLLFGVIALSDIRQNRTLLKGKAIAIAGISLSGAFIALLVLQPLLIHLKYGQYFKESDCRENMSTLGYALKYYADDDKAHKYPSANRWCDLVQKYVENSETNFVCPSGGEGKCHYAINPHCQPNSPNDMVLLFETKGGWNQFGGPKILTVEHHRIKGCNVLFNDGHVEFIKTEDIKKLNWANKQ